VVGWLLGDDRAAGCEKTVEVDGEQRLCPTVGVGTCIEKVGVDKARRDAERDHVGVEEVGWRAEDVAGGAGTGENGVEMVCGGRGMDGAGVK
jgi:hypothetical protein